jgi:threonine/homoserine/homoserine lactone efflux protein
MAHGRVSGLVSVVGVALGNLGNAVGAALGLAALFAASSFAFAVARYSGAAYLIYLGIKMLRSSHAAPANLEISRSTSLFGVFWDGFTVALLNPKTALFFAAYLPQFLPRSTAPMAQTLVFGSIFVLIAATTDSVYAVAAGSLKPWLAKWRDWGDFGNKLSGGIYIGLGLFTAFTSHRTKNSLR